MEHMINLAVVHITSWEVALIDWHLKFSRSHPLHHIRYGFHLHAQTIANMLQLVIDSLLALCCN